MKSPKRPALASCLPAPARIVQRGSAECLTAPAGVLRCGVRKQHGSVAHSHFRISQQDALSKPNEIRMLSVLVVLRHQDEPQIYTATVRGKPSDALQKTLRCHHMPGLADTIETNQRGE